MITLRATHPAGAAASAACSVVLGVSDKHCLVESIYEVEQSDCMY